MALNTVSLMGRLTADVEVKTTNTGKPVTNFTLAVNKMTNKDHPEANFIDCVAWNGTAECIARYFSKGDKLIATGRLDTSTYESKNGGKVKKTEVIVSEIDFPSSTKSTAKDESTKSSTSTNGDFISDVGDEEPF